MGFTFSFFSQRKKGGQNQSDLVSACISSLKKVRLPFHLFGYKEGKLLLFFSELFRFLVYPLYLIFYLIYWYGLRGKELTIIMQTLTFSFLPYLLTWPKRTSTFKYFLGLWLPASTKSHSILVTTSSTLQSLADRPVLASQGHFPTFTEVNWLRSFAKEKQ